MDRIKELSKKRHINKEKQRLFISKKLNTEIKATQKLLNELYRKKGNKRKVAFNRIQASDFIADIYRRQRYKIKNG